MAENKKMKTLTLGGETFEVTDEVARNEISKIKEEGSGGVQSDLSQNDATAPDYVKNRTHYEEVSEDIVLMCDGEFLRRTELQGVTLEIGKEYTVVYDGTTYISVCWDDGGFKTIGGAINDYSQYPFNISSDSDAAPEFTCADSNKHSIRISAVAIEKVVHKLDKKYLPDDIGGSVTVFYVDDTECLCHDKEMTMKVSKDEYRLALSSGVVTIATTDGYSVYYPSYTDFGYDYAKVSLWDDGDWWIVHTSEYTVAPPA